VVDQQRCGNRGRRGVGHFVHQDFADAIGVVDYLRQLQRQRHDGMVPDFA